MQFGTTKNGNPSAKLLGGKGWRRYLRIQMVAQLESQLYSDVEIAFFLKITPQYVNMLKRTPEFISARVQAGTNFISTELKKAMESTDARREMMEDLVPEALFAIRDTLINSQQPALRLKAAQDLLDREGSLAKVSRTEVALPSKFNYEEQDKHASNLLSVLQAVAAPAQKEAEKEENEVPGTAEFISASLTREQQKLMQQAMEQINQAAEKELDPQTLN